MIKLNSEELEEFMKDKNLNPILLLNTHCHLDHIFGNKFILEKYNLRTYSSEVEEINRKNSVQHAMLFGLTMEIHLNLPVSLQIIRLLHLASNPLMAFHVPGHTAGSLAFYSERKRCVFTGDALFSGSIGRTDLPGGDYETLNK